MQWNGVDRVVVFADVHGAYTELLGLLHETGIVDAKDHWAAGHAHLVSLGDLLDRGADSRKVMDLLMRLQGEAQAAGGQLHVVLGNHEAMNILGDLRYVEAGEYASYGDLESPAERVQQRQAWETAQGAGSGAAFDQKFPPGYFGHRAAFSPKGKYGQWLLTLPVAIVVNDTLYMHGGPSNVLRGMSLQELNLRYRTALTDYLGLAGQLEQAKLLQPGDAYDARPQLAKDRLAATATANGGAPDPALTDTVQRFDAAADSVLLSQEGPNWYRGAALCNEAAEADVLLPLLQQFGVARLVIGHTPTRNARAVTPIRWPRRQARRRHELGGVPWPRRGTFPGAVRTQRPLSRAIRCCAAAARGPLRCPERIRRRERAGGLRDGEVTVTGPRGPNELNVSVSNGGKSYPAVFQVRAKDAARKEVATYRLDRELKLGLVPVTVEREVQGQHGVLQGRPSKWVTQADVQQQSLRGGGWCRTEPQFQLVYAFDTLIGNEGRTAESLLIDSDSWFVYITAHEHAFGATTGLPAYLKAHPPTPGAEIRRRLQALNEAGLQAALGDLVDGKARKAILARRDALLSLPAAAAATASP